MKVLVLSGFLGAGKTTFLKELAKRTHKDFAVMENEYAPLNIDGSVLRESNEKLNIWELTEGCICCSSKADFASSVLTILNTIDPEYLIIEPTGVGMLSKILENLKNISYEKIELLSPVTLADGKTFFDFHREHRDVFEDQIRNAGTVLITKMESADPDEFARIREEIALLAPGASILDGPYQKEEDSWFLNLLSKGLSGEILTSNGQEEVPENLGLSEISLSSPCQLLLFLNGIVSGVFGNICRSKGSLKAGDSWLRFDTSGTNYSVTGCPPSEESRAVFIGSGLKRTWLREVLNQELKVSVYSSVKPQRRRG